jgi:ankyrin repeat protein
MASSQTSRRLEVAATASLLVIVGAALGGLYCRWSESKALNERLRQAINWSNAGAIQELIRRGANPRVRPHTGKTVLMVAAETGDIALMRKALLWNIEVNAREDTGVTALHHAAHRYAPVHAARLLIQHGAEVEAVTPEGYAPLHAAAANGNIPVIEVLLEAGASVDGWSKGAPTPLRLAVWYGHFESVQVLLSNGAGKHRRADDGKSAMDCAREKLESYRRSLQRSSLRTATATNAIPFKIVRLLETQPH